jgi:hypothetical protein
MLFEPADSLACPVPARVSSRTNPRISKAGLVYASLGERSGVGVWAIKGDSCSSESIGRISQRVNPFKPKLQTQNFEYR